VLTGHVGTNKYYHQLATAQLEQRNFEKAQTAVLRAIELDGSNPVSHCFLGVILQKQGKLEEAENAFLATKEHEANATVEMRILLAATFLRQGKYSEALEVFERALAIDDNNPLLYEGRGCLFIQQEKYREAESDYDSLLAIDGESIAGYKGLGLACSKQGKHEKAEAAYTKLLAMGHRTHTVYRDMGEACFKLGKYPEAEEAYNKAAEEAHQEATKAFRRSMAFIGDEKAATEMREEAMELGRMEAKCHEGLAKLFEEMKDLERAKEAYNKAIKLDSKNAQYHGDLGVLYLMLGKVEESIALSKKAIELESSPYHKILYEETLAMASKTSDYMAKHNLTSEAFAEESAKITTPTLSEALERVQARVDDGTFSESVLLLLGRHTAKTGGAGGGAGGRSR
jgi:tetratricopeptide (TPR) repeat protein